MDFGGRWASDPQLRLGKHTTVRRNCYLGGLPAAHHWRRHAGRAAYTYIISGDHCFSDSASAHSEQGYGGAPINIGKGMYGLAAHVTILPGATIGDGAIVGGRRGRDEIDSCGRDLEPVSPPGGCGERASPG